MEASLFALQESRRVLGLIESRITPVRYCTRNPVESSTWRAEPFPTLSITLGAKGGHDDLA